MIADLEVVNELCQDDLLQFYLEQYQLLGECDQPEAHEDQDLQDVDQDPHRADGFAEREE